MKIATKRPYQEPERCIACNGSGKYDITDSEGNTPDCTSCSGTGLEEDDF